MNSRAPLKKEQKGFTIIEVMIVLAIAGLIILIVFLAVPALQRNSRNTQRRNDAARVSGLVSEYVANNNGRLPTAVGTGATEVDIAVTDLSIYDSVAVGTAVAADVDDLVILPSFTCEANVATAGGGSRSYSISFNVETSNDTTTGDAQCV